MHVHSFHWNDISDYISNIDAELFNILNKIKNINSAHSFIIAKFPYGSPLLRDGKLISPCSCAECKDIISQFNQNHALGMVLQNSFEIVIEAQQGDNLVLVPMRMLQQGEFFGVFETLDKYHNITFPSPWTIYAGARSIIVSSPKSDVFLDDVQNAVGGLRSGKTEIITRNSNDHVWWKIFRKISSTELNNAWFGEVLLFSPGSLDRLLNEPELLSYLHRVGWLQLRDIRRLAIDDGLFPKCIRAKFDIQNSRHTRLLDKLHLQNYRHIVDLAEGSAIGFRPASCNNKQGPFLDILRILCDRLRHPSQYQFPFLLEPCYLNHHDSNYAYHSLNNPVFDLINFKFRLSQELSKIWTVILQRRDELAKASLDIDNSMSFGMDSHGKGNVNKFKEFMENHFHFDFADQIDIATNKICKGFTGDGIISLTDKPLFSSSFFKAFVRIVKK